MTTNTSENHQLVMVTVKPFQSVLPEKFRSDDRINVLVRLSELAPNSEYPRWRALDFKNVNLNHITVQRFVERTVQAVYGNIKFDHPSHPERIYMTPDFDPCEEILYYNGVPVWKENQ